MLAMIGIIEVLHKHKCLHLIVLRLINCVPGLNIIRIMCLLATDNSQDRKSDKRNVSSRGSTLCNDLAIIAGL